MNNIKSMKNFLVGLVTVIISVVALTIAVLKYGNLTGTNTNNNTINNSTDKIVNTNPYYTQKKPTAVPLVPQSLIKKIGTPLRQTDDLSDLTITVNNVQKIKSLKEIGIATDELSRMPKECNEDGEMEKEYTFVFINLSITNNMSVEVEKYISYFLIMNIQNALPNEPIYLSSHNSYGKDYYKYEFKPGEKADFVLGFSVYDMFVDDENLLLKLMDYTNYDPDAEYDQNYIAINS